MASNHNLKFKMINSQTKKVYNRKMSKQMTVVVIYQKPLPMACPKKSQQKVLAKI